MPVNLLQRSKGPVCHSVEHRNEESAVRKTSSRFLPSGKMTNKDNLAPLKPSVFPRVLCGRRSSLHFCGDQIPRIQLHASSILYIAMPAKKIDPDKILRQHLVDLLGGGGAHAKFDEVIKDVSPALCGKRASGLPHSLWTLLEHLRLAQWDILEFSRNKRHVSPKWPEGYWPATEVPPNDKAWDRSIKTFRKDLKAMQDLVTDPATDLYAKLPWGDGQTILREALLIADHNAYHLAQMVDLRRLLGDWHSQ